MYYHQGLPSNGGQGAEKPMLVPSPYPAQPGYPQHTMGAMPHPGLTARYATAQPHQAYAMVSNPGLAGYSSMPPTYSYPSLAAYSSMPGLTTSTPGYISASQYQASMMAQQRSMPPSPYGAPPMQAGAPLIAGYSTVPGAMPAHTQQRSIPMGVPGYPPGYPMASPAQAPLPYHHGAAAFGPPGPY